MNYFRCGGGRATHTATKIAVAKTPLATFSGNVSGLNLAETIAYIVATQSGSGTQSPTNPRTIIGVDSVSVFSTSKNYFDGTLIQGNFSNANFDIASPTSTTQRSIKIYLPVGTYTISFGGTNCRIIRRIIDGVYDTDNVINITEYTFTTTAKGYVGLSFRREDNADWTDTNIQLEAGSTATAYEAYNGTTATTALPTTCYGGYLNLETGVLTRTHKIVDLGSIELNKFNYNSTEMCFYIGSFSDKKRGYKNLICSAYATRTTEAGNWNLNNYEIGGAVNSDYVYLKNTDYTNTSDLKTSLNGVMLAYELATPTTEQLTPHQIEQLLGQNNVFANSGDVAVKYWKID